MRPTSARCNPRATRSLPRLGIWSANVLSSEARYSAHRAFFAHQSKQSVYFRFFGPRSALTDSEVTHFTTVDYHGRMAFVAFVGDEMIAVGRYDRLTCGDDAEVAFSKVQLALQSFQLEDPSFHPYNISGLLNNAAITNATGGPATVGSGYGLPNRYQLGRTIRLGVKFTF